MVDEQICIIGLGYVGLTLAVAMSDVGYKIVGVEKNGDVLNSLINKKAHFTEVGLNEKLANVLERKMFSFSNNIADARNARCFIITVGTPILGNKKTDYKSIDSVCNSLKDLLKDGDIVILRSTIQVGTTEDHVKPILDQSGKHYYLAFCPERTLEGKALLELSELPQIVGGIDEESTKKAVRIFRGLSREIVTVPNIRSAEMVKLVNNTYRDYSFAFANEVARLTDELGISATDVINAANYHYPRCNLPVPGPVGGPCLEKDPYILESSVAHSGVHAELAMAARAVNERLISWTVDSICRRFEVKASRSPKVFSLCGLAFKGQPETSDLRGSLIFNIIAYINEKFPSAEVRCWDPVVPVGEATKVLGNLKIANTFQDANSGADITIIQNNHIYFSNAHVEQEIAGMNQHGIVFDYWGKDYNRFDSLPNNIEYLILGSANVNRMKM